MQRYSLILIVVLALFWMALSGYFKGMLITLGVISIALVVLLCRRMNIMDEETVPYGHALDDLPYLSWLSREIVKANMAVVKAVLSPNLEISPTMVSVPTKRQSPTGYATFANSITLTPGTVSIEVEDGEILVHALLEDMTDPSGFAEMDRRAGIAVGDDNPKLTGGA